MRNSQMGLEHAQDYYTQYHNIDIPAKYICEDGYRLGTWIQSMRVRCKRGTLAPILKAKLDAMGMIWDKAAYEWERNFQDCKAFYQEHGGLKFPEDHKTSRGIYAQKWLDYNRQCFRKGKLSEEQIALLNSIHAFDDFHPKGWTNPFETKKQPQKRLYIRMTAQELQFVTKQANAAGFANVQSYVQAILGTR